MHEILTPKASNFIKKGSLAQLFFCEFSKISKNTFFIEHLWWLLLKNLNVEFDNPGL